MMSSKEYQKVSFLLCVRYHSFMDLISIGKRDMHYIKKIGVGNEKGQLNTWGLAAHRDCWFVGGEYLNKIRLITKKD